MNRKKDGAIVGAYTGYLMCSFNDYHLYIEELMGRPVFTDEIPSIADEIKERALDDWIDLQSKLTEEEKTIIDNWTLKKIGKDEFVALARKLES